MSEAGRLLDAVFEHAPVGLAVVDEALRYCRVNPILAEMNGRAPEEHLGRSVTEIVGDAGPDFETLLRSVMETGEPVVGLPISGATPADPQADRHFRGTYVPVRDEDGRPAVLGIVSEHTAERAAGERAAEAASLLDAVYAAAPVGLAFWTPDLRFARINEELARINGRPVDEHVGRSLGEVLGEFADRVEACLREAMTSRRRVDITHRDEAVTPGGPERDYAASYYPVVGPSGELLGAGGVVVDVTERRRAERDRDRLLKEALTARAHAEAAQMRAEEAQRSAEAARARTEFLAEAGRRLAASMDVEATLQEMAEITVPAVADCCVVTLREETGALNNVAVAHADPGLVRQARAFSERFPPDPRAPVGVARCIRSGELELIPEVTDEVLVSVARNDEHLALLRALGATAVLFVPLEASGEVIGALTLMRSWGRTFGDDDVALARALAPRAALHVNQARLYAERSHVARTLQAGLLPRRLPQIPGAELAARYEAAGQRNEVGGDFYDVFEVPGDAWIAVIGDVSGKGPEAAAVTSLARHTLRTMLTQRASTAQALQVLNQALRDQVADRFCTVACARIEPSASGLRACVSAAGHPPPLVRSAGGAVRAVEASGTLLGALPEIEIAERTEDLAPGDMLVLYTDGLVELRGRRPDFGERWLPEALGRAQGGVADVLAELQRCAIALQGGVARDDMALLAVRAVSS